MIRNISIFMLGAICFSTRALTPQNTNCKRFDSNTVCTYNVTGEDIQDPHAASQLYSQTDMPYALCSKALCTPDPDDTNKATCECPIYGLASDAQWQKASVGPYNYSKSRPTAINGKLKTVTSNFSLANATPSGDVPQTTCAYTKPTPWANCYGVRCDVEYDNAGVPHAICACPTVETKEFVSIGPDGPKDCSKGIWSAASKSQGTNNNAIMKDLYERK